jgi:serine/threonine protein kinase
MYNNFKKIENILYAIKFMNENKLIFDDLKKDNIIIVNDKMKFCDFSTIINMKDLDLNTLNKSMLRTIFYYIYNPILNILLYYYISVKENNVVIIDNIINNIKIDQRNKENIDYINYNKRLISKIKSYTKELDISINIKNIFKNIYFYYLRDKNNYKIIITKFIEYFNNKYEDIELIISELISRIHIYSLGIIFLQYIDLYIEQKNKECDKIFLKKCIEIYKLCSLQINIFDDNNDNNENNEDKNDIDENYIDENDIDENDNIYVSDINIEIIINKFNEIEC